MPSYPHHDTSPSIQSDIEPSDEIKVLITGFGPFRDQYPRNPSSLIAHSLPSTFTLAHPPSTSELSTTSSATPKFTTIRLVPYPKEIHVSFKTVRTLIPAIYSSPSFPDYDPLYAQCSYIVHIGMARTANEYTVERQGHRDGYYINRGTGDETRDVDGKTLRECEEEMGSAEGEYWRECPELLQTTLDVDDILERMHQPGPSNAPQLPGGITVEVSDDAGNYLCDFIYYSSLSHFWRKNGGDDGKRPVVFLHVPPESDEEVLERGREVTKALIGAIVASERSRNI